MLSFPRQRQQIRTGAKLGTRDCWKTRGVESDLRKAAQKIVNKKPVYKVPLQQLEENCTRRALKKPKVQFDLQVKGSELKKGNVEPVSLSGTSALVAIADKEENEQDVTKDFENVWGNEIFLRRETTQTKKMHELSALTFQF